MPPAPVAELEALILRLNTLTARRDGYSRTADAALSRLHTAGPTRLTELAGLGRGAQPQMSAPVAPLVDQGLARRDSYPTDARVVLLSLTRAGVDLVTSRRAD